MRVLKIEYNGMTLFDGEVSELQWSDGAGGVTVHGKVGGQKPSGAGILEMITNASKQKTEEKRKELVDSAGESALG